jgi:hypothetical protein
MSQVKHEQRSVMLPVTTTKKAEMARFESAPAFQITRTGLRVNGAPSFDEAAEFGRQLATLEHAVQFTIGAFCEYLDERFGEQASQIIDEGYGWNLESIKVYRWVHSHVPEENRRADLSFKHHQLVAKLSPAQQKRWLTRAAEGADGVRWSTSQLSSALRDGSDAPVTSVWLLVLCRDRKDRDDLQAELEGKGRTTKAQDRREKSAEPRRVTARARNVGRKKGRSKG